MFTTEEHWRHFADFCRWEIASGGPDPQIDMVREMSRDAESRDERVWRALCYIAVYNVPYGEVLWRELPWPEVLNLEESWVRAWLDEKFAAGQITTRVERRCVRRADWMAEYLIAARRWVGGGHARDLAHRCREMDPHAAYDLAWNEVTSLPRIGRYVALKLLELLRREDLLRAEPRDIRPRDAWSPRKTLQELWPDREIPNRDNSPGALDATNRAVDDTLARLRDEFGVPVTMFQSQVLLCEYRESHESRRQYPGRSLDSELGYARRAEAEWGHRSDMWRARRALFPLQHLGEHGGWDGPRKDVAAVLATHRYTWTDLVYDYRGTTELSSPVRWTEDVLA